MDRAQRQAQVQAQLQARYRDIKRPEMRAVMSVQDEILSALRDHLRGIGFIEILAPIIGPATDPGIRGAQQVSFDYYGTKFKVMSSMILYKQMAVNSLDRVFALSPNIRLEPIETLETGRHLTEFRQLDLEVARASYFDVMEIGEGMVTYVVKRVKANCLDELDVLGRELKTPKLPFKKITCRDAVELLREKGFEVKQGEEISWNAEAELSRSFGDFFWLIDYPKTARGFYDRRTRNARESSATSTSSTRRATARPSAVVRGSTSTRGWSRGCYPLARFRRRTGGTSRCSERGRRRRPVSA
jgi:asparaginyl-tRNA synthetase